MYDPSSSPLEGKTLSQPLHPDQPRPAVLLEEGRHPGRLAGVLALLQAHLGVLAGPGHVGGGAALEVVLDQAVVLSLAPRHPHRAPGLQAERVRLLTLDLLVVDQQDGEGEAVQEEVYNNAENYDGDKGD